MRVVGKLRLYGDDATQIFDFAFIGKEPAWLSHEPTVAKSN